VRRAREWLRRRRGEERRAIIGSSGDADKVEIRTGSVELRFSQFVHWGEDEAGGFLGLLAGVLSGAG